jgi:hypothetical protein
LCFSQILADFSRRFSRILFLADYFLADFRRFFLLISVSR